MSDSRTCCKVVDARSWMVLNKFSVDDDAVGDDNSVMVLPVLLLVFALLLLMLLPTPDVPDISFTLGDVGA